MNINLIIRQSDIPPLGGPLQGILPVVTVAEPYYITC